MIVIIVTYFIFAYAVIGAVYAFARIPAFTFASTGSINCSQEAKQIRNIDKNTDSAACVITITAINKTDEPQRLIWDDSPSYNSLTGRSPRLVTKDGTSCPITTWESQQRDFTAYEAVEIEIVCNPAGIDSYYSSVDQRATKFEVTNWPFKTDVVTLQ